MSEGHIPLEQNHLARNSGSGAKKTGRLSKMYQKQKRLAMINGNFAKTYIIETKIVDQSHGGQGHAKKRGKKWDQFSLSC
jgi:hypothetical protein